MYMRSESKLVAKILKKGLKIKKCIKTPYIWSVKYTNFDEFYKKPFTKIAKPMPEDYFPSS